MADLISRAYVLAEYDSQHKGPPGGVRKIIEDAPTIDAIPVEWLDKMAEQNQSGVFNAYWFVLKTWQKEQEAR